MDTTNQEKLLKQIGERILYLRKKKSLTQLDLAVQSNLEESAIQRIEKGRVNSTIKTLQKVSEALEVEFYELFVFTKLNENS